jgi:hypothetical protein
MNDNYRLPLALALFFSVISLIGVLMLMIPYPPKIVHKDKVVKMELIYDYTPLPLEDSIKVLNRELAKYKSWYIEERNKEWLLREEIAKLKEEK